MASEIRVNTINNRSGLGTVSITDTGLVVSGIITATTLDTSSTSTFSSDVSIADKIIHTGDTNTAIRFPANDQISFEVGGVERLRVHSNNYIGINSSIPLRPLDVTAPLGVNIPLVITSGSNQTNGFIAIKDPNTSGNFNNRIGCEGDNLLFWTGGGEALRITSAGNVGIGTDDPGNHKLHLYGETNPDLRLTATGNDIVNIFVDSNRSSADTPIFAIKGEWNGTQIANMKFVAGADTTNKDDGYITFNTRESGTGASSERLRITSTGNVGIGSDSPSEKLDVNGAIKVYQNTNIATFKNNQLRSDAAGTYYFDHGTTGQSFTFRTSTSSSLDTTGPSITSAGNLSFPSGKGIDFSATADGGTTTPSELLDDYEEGTWTPNFTGVTYTASVQFGRYTKIGRYVYCTITIDGSISNGSSNIGLEGLPFSADEASDNGQRSSWHPANGGHMAGLSINDARFRVNGSTMQGVKGATGNTTYMTGDQLTSGTFQFTGDFSYYTSS